MTQHTLLKVEKQNGNPNVTFQHKNLNANHAAERKPCLNHGVFTWQVETMYEIWFLQPPREGPGPSTTPVDPPRPMSHAPSNKACTGDRAGRSSWGVEPRQKGHAREDGKACSAAAKSKSTGKWAETLVPLCWHKERVIFLSLSLAPLWGWAASYHTHELYIWELAIYSRKSYAYFLLNSPLTFHLVFLSSPSSEVAKGYGCFPAFSLLFLLFIMNAQTIRWLYSHVQMAVMIPYSLLCGLCAVFYL